MQRQWRQTRKKKYIHIFMNDETSNELLALFHENGQILVKKIKIFSSFRRPIPWDTLVVPPVLWSVEAAFDAPPAVTKWFWTAMASTVCRGTCWWRTL